MSFLTSPRPKFKNHLIFMTFHNRIFFIFVFDKISKGMIVTIEKEPSEYFQRLHFWNQLDFDFKIRSGQVCRPSLVCKFYTFLDYILKARTIHFIRLYIFSLKLSNESKQRLLYILYISNTNAVTHLNEEKSFE